MMRRPIIAALVLAAGAMTAGCAQQALAPNPDCPRAASDMPISALYGRWEATIEGESGVSIMTLQRHPDYDGVRGTLQRSGLPPAQLAGDIDPEGQLALDESQDGKSISASWAGALQPGSCGREFRGDWFRSSDDSQHPFVLRRSSTWK